MTREPSRRWLSSLLAAALSSVVAGTSFAQPARIGTADSPLVIATARFHGFLPAYRLPEMLKPQGISVKIIEFPSATERLEAVAAGYAHMSYAGLTASLLLRARGKDVVIVAATNEKGRALVGRPEMQSIADLKGKKIGVVFGSIEHMSTIAVLKRAGIDAQKDAQLVNIPAPDQPIAFQSKSIDAFMAFEPWAIYGVRNFGGKVLAYPYDTALGAIDSGVETSEKFVAERPDLVRAVVKAHIQAVDFYRSNPDEVIKTGVANYKVPEEIMRESMKNVDLSYEIKPDNIKALGQYLAEIGFISPQELQGIAWDKLVNTSFLAEARK